MKHKKYVLVRMSAFEGMSVQMYDKYATAVTAMADLQDHDRILYDNKVWITSKKWGYWAKNALGQRTKTHLYKIY